MIGGFEYALIALAIGGLLYSGHWTDRTYARFDEIPGHFDIRGHETRLAARRPMAWALPVGFSIMLAGLALFARFVPAEYINGDPRIAVWSMILCLPAAQCLFLWLLARWAAKQA